MTILVVCGAGASSTFVAQRLTRAAHAAGLDWECSAGTAGAVDTATADTVLVGPHLAGRLAELDARTPAAVLALPDDVFTDLTGERTLALVRSTLHDETTPPAEKGIS